jgi:hypothetical protein
MNSSATSFVSWPPSMVLFATTKTRRAKIAARLDIASTTVPTSGITRPTSSAVSVATLDTWPEIARIASAVATGDKTTVALNGQQQVVLELGMPSTESTSRSCKSCLVVVLPELDLNSASKLVLEDTTMPGPETRVHPLGLVARPARLLPGLDVKIVMVVLVEPLPGPAVVATTTIPATARTTTVLLRQLQPAPLHGNKPLFHLHLVVLRLMAMELIQAMMLLLLDMELHQEWLTSSLVLLLILPRHRLAMLPLHRFVHGSLHPFGN